MKVFFRSGSLVGELAVPPGSRLKDEIDYHERELVQLDAEPSPVLVAMAHVRCIAAPDDGVRPAADPARWGVRVHYSVAFRCDGLDVTGTLHAPVGTPLQGWLGAKDGRFHAVTNATVSQWGGEPESHPVAFVARAGVEAIWWSTS